MRIALVTGLLLLGAACTRAEGTLVVDGATREVTGCGSAQPLGYDGVDLDLDDGATVRVFRAGGAATGVGYFPDPLSDAGYLVGDCVTGEVRDTNVKRDDSEFYELAGDVTFACDEPLAITGSATFTGCF